MGFRDGIGIAHRLGMSRNATARNLSSAETLDEAPAFSEDDEAPTTQRIHPFELAKALQLVSANFDDVEAQSFVRSTATNDDEAFDAPDRTLMVTRDEADRLVARAFDHDDEITIDAPVPDLPPGTPSPIELDLDLDGPDHIPELAPILAPDSPLAADLPYVACSPSLELRDRGAAIAISGVRLCVSPGMKHTIHEAREAVRLERATQTRTRVLVGAIWLLAVTIASVLAFIASTP